MSTPYRSAAPPDGPMKIGGRCLVLGQLAAGRSAAPPDGPTKIGGRWLVLSQLRVAHVFATRIRHERALGATGSW